MERNNEQGIIISLGSVNADFQVRVDKKPGSTTTMLAHDFRRLSGGKAANVAFLARRLGVPALLLARVGMDELSEQALSPLKDLEVDLSWVKKVKNVSTGVSMIAVPADGKKNIILAANANDKWTEEGREEVRQAIEQAPPGSVLVVDYEVPPFIVEEAIVKAEEKRFKIILDPSPADRVDYKLFPKIDFISPDASETEDLTGIKADSVENAARAARELHKKGVKTAVVRMQEGGCVLINAREGIYVPPIEIDIVDTTGAGDAFAGAFAVAVLENKNLREAACFAASASLLSITSYGSQPAYPSREEISTIYDKVYTQIRNIDS